jgi:hypothetical protein
MELRTLASTRNNSDSLYPITDWCSILGAVALSEGAKMRLEALGVEFEKLPPGANSNDVDLPEDIAAKVKYYRTDATVFLSMGVTFLREAEKQGASQGKQPPPPETIRSMHSRMSIVLAYALRHLCASNCTWSAITLIQVVLHVLFQH